MRGALQFLCVAQRPYPARGWQHLRRQLAEAEPPRTWRPPRRPTSLALCPPESCSRTEPSRPYCVLLLDKPPATARQEHSALLARRTVALPVANARLQIQR